MGTDVVIDGFCWYGCTVAYWTARRCMALACSMMAPCASVACFDSDETFAARQTTTGEPSTSSSSTTEPATGTTEAESTGSTGAPPVTCRDAIDCIRECALDVIVSQVPEPDLSCFLDCEEGLTVREAYHLLRLGNCASDVCSENGKCTTPMDGTGTGTGTGDSGSSSDTGGSSSSSTTTGVPPGGEEPVLDACLQCIFLLMGDVNSTGCEEFHAQCV